MNVRHPEGEKISYDKMDLRLFYFHVTMCYKKSKPLSLHNKKSSEALYSISRYYAAFAPLVNRYELPSK